MELPIEFADLNPMVFTTHHLCDVVLLELERVPLSVSASGERSLVLLVADNMLMGLSTKQPLGSRKKKVVHM